MADASDSRILYAEIPVEARFRTAALAGAGSSFALAAASFARALLPRDTYRLQVVGISMGTYNLTAVKILGNESTVFNAIAIPITPGAIHQYTVDWDKLSKGEGGITVEVDSDGDGKFDLELRRGKELTQGDFTPPLEVTLRSWIPFIGVAIALILVLLAAIILRARRRKLPPPPPLDFS